MLCEQCKIREASVVIRETINGTTTERKLCNQCAAETELGSFLEGDSSFARLLSGILGIQTDSMKEEEAMDQIICPTCHTAYSEFIKNSQFGCADCYNTFGILLDKNIRKIQGNDTHVGKRPKFGGSGESHQKNVDFARQQATNSEKIEILSAKLKEAIQDEEYESAARYRDEIRLLKGKAD